MNNNILKKCVQELSQDNPKLDYIRGMLETLIEMQEPKLLQVSAGTPINEIPVKVTAVPTDEADILNAKAAAALEQTKRLAAKSVEIT